MSLTTTAHRSPWSLLLRMYDSSVVLPAPRNPDKSVTGSRESFSGTGILVVDFGGVFSTATNFFRLPSEGAGGGEGRVAQSASSKFRPHPGGGVGGVDKLVWRPRRCEEEDLDGDETPARSLARRTSHTSVADRLI